MELVEVAAIASTLRVGRMEVCISNSHICTDKHIAADGDLLSCADSGSAEPSVYSDLDASPTAQRPENNRVIYTQRSKL